MIKILANSWSHKIIKNVTVLDDAIRYVVFGFFWSTTDHPQIRVIYNNVSPNFTVWALDKTTGIWGCFADQNDLGFDYIHEYDKLFAELPALRQKDPAALELLEDQLCANFLKLAKEHIESLYHMHIKLEPNIVESFKLKKLVKLNVHVAGEEEKVPVVAIVDSPIEP